MIIHRPFASKLFEAFSITRWNDRIRPIELVEMDKHALKSMLTFFIGKLEETEHEKKIDWEFIVCGNIFALLKNIVLSDIKAPILTKLKNDHPEDFQELNKWVVSQYKLYIDDSEFLNQFQEFVAENTHSHKLELDILRAAHKYSSFREFEIIHSVNESVFPEIETIQSQLTDSLNEFDHLNAIYQLLTKGAFYKFICRLDQLRCQTRWSQTARIPKTSVLGHSMYVATLSYLLSRRPDYCQRRRVNNFFAGLFHDIPESVTRDIISPVKRATDSLPDAIKKIEHEVCETELFTGIPTSVKEDLKFLLGDIENSTGDEYTDRIRENSTPRFLSGDEKISAFNENIYDPVDGRLNKVCDDIAAYMEAFKSIEQGISTHHLQEGLANLRNKYAKVDSVEGFPVRQFFTEFE